MPSLASSLAASPSTIPASPKSCGMGPAGLLDRIRSLSGQGLHPSAVFMASVCIREYAMDGAVKAQFLVALGDALTASGQHPRALVSYRQATNEGGFLGDAPPELRLKIARCLIECDLQTEAICELEKGPRNAAGSVLLVQLRRRHKSSTGLVSELQNALKQEPFAFEAAQLLLELEAEQTQVEELITQEPAWVSPWLRAYAAAASFKPQQALSLFRDLLALPGFRNHPHVFINVAKTELQLGNREAALTAFNRARILDPLEPDSADVHASLLRGPADLPALTALCHDVYALRKTRPEPWVALGLLQEAQGHQQAAVAFAHRALEIDPTHLPALHYIGALWLSLGRPSKSLEEYTKAYALKRDYNSFKGLVFALLHHTPPKITDALIVAKEALETMPLDARTCIIVGRVFAANTGTEDKSLRAFARAIRLDPHNHEGPCCFADVCLAQHGRGAGSRENTLLAVAALKPIVERPNPKDFVVFKMGKLLAAIGDYAGALRALHQVLSITPGHAESKEAIDQLEKELGVPPAQHHGTATAPRPQRRMAVASPLVLSSASPTVTTAGGPARVARR